ncbi:MAG: cytochrome ubiquinol oxidase subunit I [Deltaproteobacteria bacterium]|nr:cytochrome ubiquinol oxidase subunit I [Deltaproteobacteria bacterium]
MDSLALLLARFQFGMTAFFHFLYPPLTIGLGTLLVITEGIYVFSKNQEYLRITRFFAKLFAINFVVGVATGIVMEFQFGTNWSQYSSYVGAIFGAPLAIEGLFAFFMESIFVGVMLLGWNRLSAKAHWVSTIFVALGSTLSAVWILVANSWMQSPAGYKIGSNGIPKMTNFWHVVFNPYFPSEFIHVIGAAWEYSAFFMAGVAAWFLIKNNKDTIMRKALKVAVISGVIVACLQIVLGDISAREVVEYQPTKLAMMEAQWHSQRYAPETLFALPNNATESNGPQIGIPGMLSMLAYMNPAAKVMGLNQAIKYINKKDFKTDGTKLTLAMFPPVSLVFWSFHIMMYFGFYFALIMLIALYLLFKGKLYDSPKMLKVFWFSTFLPLIAIEFGWFTTEIGRQPFTVYGLLTTVKSVSPNVSFVCDFLV